MLNVYGMSLSGNCYKIKLLLTQLNMPFSWQEIDIMKGETSTPEFRARNPNGQVPVLEIEPGRYLAESNAILFYLAEGTPYFPTERFERAQVMEWMFFEQYSHEPYIAVARFICQFLPADHPRQRLLENLRMRGYKTLAVMETHLQKNIFFVGNRYTIADIALYAYTHVAHEGGFDLQRFPALQRWMQRFESQQDYFPMTQNVA